MVFDWMDASSAFAFCDAICNRSAWTDALLLALVALATIGRHVLWKRMPLHTSPAAAAKAEELRRLVCIATGAGVFAIVAQLGLLLFEGAYC